MIERIKQALEAFKEDPVTAGRVLRELVHADGAVFYQSALPELESGCETQGHQYLITLLVQNGFLIDDLPSRFSKQVSISLARRIAQVDRQLTTKLAMLLRRENGGPGKRVAGPIAEHVLDLLEAIAPGPAIVPYIAHLALSRD